MAVLLGAGSASAHGLGFGMGMALSPDEVASRQQKAFESEAALLGVNVDAVKSGWAQGKSLAQIAADNNISADQLKAKVQAAHLDRMKSQLQTLVTKDIITQAQADARLQFMQSHVGQHGKRNGMKPGKGFRGFGF